MHTEPSTSPSALIIAQDCDAIAGVVVHPGDVHVGGSVRERAELKAAGEILIAGAIEAAIVEAGKDLRVAGGIVGGIVGKDQGRCVAGANIACRFSTNAHLTAGGDVELEASMLRTHVACSGKLKVRSGSIAGGQICANGGVTCKSLGSEAHVPTIVEAGTDRNFIASASAALALLDVDRKRVLSVRHAVAPLLAQLKRLSPKQKERATELLFEADELDAITSKKLAELKRQWDLTVARACPQITVGDVVHPGVTIRFDGMETLVGAALKGPLTFTTRKVGTATEIVVIDGFTQDAAPLPTFLVEDAALQMIHVLLGDRAKAAA
jgi:uncharacterized protein (DUF342 family)